MILATSGINGNSHGHGAPQSHSWVLWPLPPGARGLQSICLLGAGGSLDFPDSGCRGGGFCVGGGRGSVGGWAAAPWPSGELMEVGRGRCRERGWTCGLLVRTPCVHTCTPATWGAGPWAPRKSARVTGLQGEPHRTRGARSHCGVLLQLFSQLALASGTRGPGAPRSAGPRPFPGGATPLGEGRTDLQGSGGPARTPGLPRWTTF